MVVLVVGLWLIALRWFFGVVIGGWFLAVGYCGWLLRLVTCGWFLVVGYLRLIPAVDLWWLVPLVLLILCCSYRSSL